MTLTTKILLEPGKLTLADLRALYQGAPVLLHAASRARVDAAAQLIDTIARGTEAVYGINTGFGRLASTRIDPKDTALLQRNLVVSHAVGVGAPLGSDIVRLMMALKITNMCHGLSGARWLVVQMMADMLAKDILPVIPGQGSVGASGDLAPLAHLAAAMIGEGKVLVRGKMMPAAAGLAKAGLQPVVLGPKEGLALLNGTQVSTALALAGLFQAETLFSAALVTGALSTDAAKGSDTPFDPRIHAARGQRGQIDVAASLRSLLALSAIRESHRIGDDRVQDPYCLRCQPQVMGACLDAMRYAAGVLIIEANGVTDNPLVFADTCEVLSGGNFHAEPVGFVADHLALAIAEIGSLAERRIAMLTDHTISRLPPALTKNAGLNSGFMVAHVTAAALAAENKTRAVPTVTDSIPTSANQEDHVSMATHGARRLGDMAVNTGNIIAIELLAAARGIGFHAPLTSSPRLAKALALVAGRPALEENDVYLSPEIEFAAGLVAGGALGAAVGSETLPTLEDAR